VIALRDRGVPVSSAIASVTRGRAAGVAPSGRDRGLRREIDEAVRQFDEARFGAAFDRSLAVYGLADTVYEVVLPYLHDVGTEWASGRMTVAQEHFVSHLVRRRLGALAVNVDDDAAPTALLACPPGERHDIAVLALGVLISGAGWKVRFLGADTPMPDLEEACASIDPDLVVISATKRSVLDPITGVLQWLNRTWPVALGGRGASTAVANLTGARLLPDDLRDTVDLLSDLDAWRRASR
jgi:methanogenic corrinoid protein MtbC1